MSTFMLRRYDQLLTEAANRIGVERTKPQLTLKLALELYPELADSPLLCEVIEKQGVMGSTLTVAECHEISKFALLVAENVHQSVRTIFEQSKSIPTPPKGEQS